MPTTGKSSRFGRGCSGLSSGGGEGFAAFADFAFFPLGVPEFVFALVADFSSFFAISAPFAKPFDGDLQQTARFQTPNPKSSHPAIQKMATRG
jgi:hypothetical protein